MVVLLCHARRTLGAVHDDNIFLAGLLAEVKGGANGKNVIFMLHTSYNISITYQIKSFKRFMIHFIMGNVL